MQLLRSEKTFLLNIIYAKYVTFSEGGSHYHDLFIVYKYFPQIGLEGDFAASSRWIHLAIYTLWQYARKRKTLKKSEIDEIFFKNYLLPSIVLSDWQNHHVTFSSLLHVIRTDFWFQSPPLQVLKRPQSVQYLSVSYAMLPLRFRNSSSRPLTDTDPISSSLCAHKRFVFSRRECWKTKWFK